MNEYESLDAEVQTLWPQGWVHTRSLCKEKGPYRGSLTSILTEKKVKAPTQLRQRWGFPGGPVAKTLHSQCSGPRFKPWLGNCISRTATKALTCCNEDLVQPNK